ncbi:putative extracellular serine carboxypeptidase [Mycena indigotica]|uniref:Putative extracellular serine carboxypeptidase n=1 Tax=Mycena indigotica TaxID=2126181 RepID=A0A8H6VYK9_9AGAR|nr:putative extracellular serine carboxypeptidase [Mycena indigotica]KAF7292899.1 putative extracellular serine carboxypeptidase [Mycena indigotica]
MLLQLSALAFLSVAHAYLSDGRPHANFTRKATVPVVPVVQTGPVFSKNGTLLPPYGTTFTFQQLIDHNNPSLGTFTQRYWHIWEFYEQGKIICTICVYTLQHGHLDDVAASLRINLWDWQHLSPAIGPGAPSGGWGLDHALNAWSSYWRNTYYLLPSQSFVATVTQSSRECLGSYDTSRPYWADTSVNNAFRSCKWLYLLLSCNELGFLQESAPSGVPSLVSPAYLRPPSIPTPPNVHVDRTNTLYAGWNVPTSNLFFANGERDSWLYATMSAPGVTIQSTPSQPIAVGPGYHCSDILAT